MKLENRFIFLTEVKDVLDKAGITNWIDFGTLLGFYRGGDFIEYDLDIDISVRREDQEKVMAICKELKKIGRLVARVDIGETGKHYLAGYEIFKDDIKMDIAFYFKCENKRIWPFSEHPKVLVFPEEFFDNLDEIEIKGVKFKTPHNIEKCLELHYGKDWRIPKTDAEYDLHSMPNIESSIKYLKYLT